MRALFTTYEGGGHVPPALTVARRLQDRGWTVLFVSDEATRAAADREGLPFQAWTRAPNRAAQAQADDPLEDWRARAPWSVVRAVCDAVITGPAADYAADTKALIEQFRPDVIVSMELLFGVMAAAEATQTPLALLTGNLWCFPTREDVPPFGPGFRASPSAWALGRDRTTRRIIARWYDVGLADLNAARSGLGLPPLARTLDQLQAARLILLGVARALDWSGSETGWRSSPSSSESSADPSPKSPRSRTSTVDVRFLYAGPLLSVPEWARVAAPAPSLAGRPLVLVSFSTTFQDQAPVMRRCIEALSGLPVQGIATLGPAMQVAHMPRAANVEVVQSASHDEIVPRCAAMICHGGHGTVLRPLTHGVPVLCLPMGRDQPENAVRIAARGAGLVLPKTAGAGRIARAVARLLGEPSFRARAARLGASVAAEADGGERAADAIAGLAAQRNRMA